MRKILRLKIQNKLELNVDSVGEKGKFTTPRFRFIKACKRIIQKILARIFSGIFGHGINF